MKMKGEKIPDMLINSDMKILQQILGMALGKGNGVSIPVFTINQVVVNLNVSGDHRKAVVEGSGEKRTRSEAAKLMWEKRKEIEKP
jgi:archaellum component FlaG (FlaF/FlaG flagellin family)